MIYHGCISVLPAGLGPGLGSTANWWVRSPNYNNSNNFCNVNTNGNANNNNANNSLGVAPDFVSQKWSRSNIVAMRTTTFTKGEMLPETLIMCPKLSFDTAARTPPFYRACMAGDAPRPVPCVAVLQVRRCPTNTCTEDEL